MLGDGAAGFESFEGENALLGPDECFGGDAGTAAFGRAGSTCEGCEDAADLGGEAGAGGDQRGAGLPRRGRGEPGDGDGALRGPRLLEEVVVPGGGHEPLRPSQTQHDALVHLVDTGHGELGSELGGNPPGFPSGHLLPPRGHLSVPELRVGPGDQPGVGGLREAGRGSQRDQGVRCHVDAPPTPAGSCRRTTGIRSKRRPRSNQS